MKAVILATGYSEAMEPLIYKRPTALLRVADKPIIVHVIEALARQGITNLHIVLSHFPEMIEKILEEGSRWGVQITYHLTTDWRRPFRTLTPAAKAWRDPWVAIASADLLPKHHIKELSEPPKSLLWYSQGQKWTGWGIVPRQTIADLNRNIQFEDFPSAVQEATRQTIQEPFLSALSVAELQRSNLHCLRLADPFALFPSAARRVQAGVWISRGVVIHPTATIIPPVFLSEYAQVRDGAQIGPEAIVEGRCVIDKGSVIKKSIICRDSYVGEALAVRNSIVDHNMLLNLSHKSHIHLADEFILSQLKPPLNRFEISGYFFRAITLAGLIAIAPLLVLLITTCGLTSKKVLKLPTSIHRRKWRTFSLLRLNRSPKWLPSWFSSLPAMINLVKGQVHLVGLRPMSISEVEALPLDWRHLYLRSKVGLITLEYVNHGENPSQEERLANDSYYATKRTLRLDFKILWRWIRKQLAF